MSTRIVVLNDGETYTGIEGCQILTLTLAGEQGLDSGEIPDPSHLMLEETGDYDPRLVSKVTDISTLKGI